MKKINIILYITIVIFILYYVSRPLHLHTSDGIQNMIDFYELPENCVDVLFLGSSHVFENINTILLWENKGYLSYVLAGSCQPFWNTYYFLKESLKSQHPKVIVLDVYCAILNEDYQNDIGVFKNTYGMKWSLDKIKAICVSSKLSHWVPSQMPIFQEHLWYANLSSENFPKITGIEHIPNMFFGYGVNFAVEENIVPEIKYLDKAIRLHNKTEKYLLKILELAKERNIPILFISAPYAAYSEGHESKYNSVERIAISYGVQFINYNYQYERIGLDFSKDFADDSHLNYYGSEKFTKILGEDLNQMFAIPNRRDSPYAYIWDKESIRFKKFLLSRGIIE